MDVAVVHVDDLGAQVARVIAAGARKQGRAVRVRVVDEAVVEVRGGGQGEVVGARQGAYKDRGVCCRRADDEEQLALRARCERSALEVDAWIGCC